MLNLETQWIKVDIGDCYKAERYWRQRWKIIFKPWQPRSAKNFEETIKYFWGQLTALMVFSPLRQVSWIFKIFADKQEDNESDEVYCRPRGLHVSLSEHIWCSPFVFQSMMSVSVYFVAFAAKNAMRWKKLGKPNKHSREMKIKLFSYLQLRLHWAMFNRQSDVSLYKIVSIVPRVLLTMTMRARNIKRGFYWKTFSIPRLLFDNLWRIPVKSTAKQGSMQ